MWSRKRKLWRDGTLGILHLKGKRRKGVSKENQKEKQRNEETKGEHYLKTTKITGYKYFRNPAGD